MFLIYRDTTLCPSVIYGLLTRRQATEEFLLRSVSCTTTRTSMHLPNHDARRALQSLLCCQTLPVQRNLGTTANKRNSITKRTQNSLVWSLVPLHRFSHSTRQVVYMSRPLAPFFLFFSFHLDPEYKMRSSCNDI